MRTFISPISLNYEAFQKSELLRSAVVHKLSSVKPRSVFLGS
jgi:hypothetical protein